MLIIGCGNRERGDDGAGILVAERLRKFGIEAETCIGNALDLIEAWKNADDVIVVDAVVTGAPLGTNASTHGLGVAEAIKLAHVLNRLPRRLWVYGIEGERFDLGSEISPEVRRGVEEAVRRIISDLSMPLNNRPAIPRNSASY